mmetsp:Transcript_146344/g.407673  ORF Transcript_146344/g.407673 Transcript_146344/m.407673 type:complete len:148 (-) Transcript_146344:304-747(-)
MTSTPPAPTRDEHQPDGEQAAARQHRLLGRARAFDQGRGLTAIAGNIANLSALIQLQELVLFEMGISSDTAVLTQLTKLTVLTLEQTSISGDIAILAQLTKLMTLSLTKTGISGDIAVLAQLAKLTQLGLSQRHPGATLPSWPRSRV